jgi:hypothetical protein
MSSSMALYQCNTNLPFGPLLRGINRTLHNEQSAVTLLSLVRFFLSFTEEPTLVPSFAQPTG